MPQQYELDTLAVLLIDSDPVFTASLLHALHTVRPSWNLRAIQRPDKSTLAAGYFNACIVDGGPEPNNASRIWSECAQTAPSTALIGVSWEDSTELRIAALQSGARDFLSKPLLNAADLAMRTKTHCLLAQHRPISARSGRIGFGRLEVDLEHQVIFVDGAPVSLTSQQRRMLLRLAQTPGQTVSHAELCRNAGIQPRQNHVNLHNQVCRLRKRLGSAAEELVSLPGAGLQLGTPKENPPAEGQSTPVQSSNKARSVSRRSRIAS